MGRQEYIDIFEDTMHLCKTDEQLKRSLEESLEKQYFLPESAPLILKAEPKEKPAEVTVSQKRTFEAAEAYKGKRVCVLNFASSKNPGGGVERGASAQEECLCRVSTLFPCLTDEGIMNSFYIPHRTMFRDTLYNSDLIFTPGVTVFKSDTNMPALRPRDEWFTADVITCAAPNLGAYTRLDDKSLEKLHTERGERIFLTAINEGAEVLILGAFGCGAFRNPPAAVAGAYRTLTGKYAAYFDKIEYAVYCPPKNTSNYSAFRNTLAPVITSEG